MSANNESCCQPTSGQSAVAATAATAQPKVKLPCPQCGETGQFVATQTLKQHVKPQHLETVERGPFNLCRSATCEIVYFNAEGVALNKADVRERIGLKETADPVPICYCFGWTEKMAEDEIRATGKCAIPARITAEVKAGNCACEIRNPQGSCCLGNVNAAVKSALAKVASENAAPMATR